MNYYNEFDRHAAAWLQGLIDENLIPPGHVDTRSITEISPSDLHGYTQCHFFAGIGGWPFALQLAGVPATRPLWTGSCPCQPFSDAGQGKGIEDERHLWPVFFDLIRVCKPDLVFGEQVASAAVLGSSAKPTKRSAGKAVQPVWLDGVFADLESASYACGSSDIPAASIGAPHIRQRCWWGAVRMADANGRDSRAKREQSSGEFGLQPEGDGACGMADSDNQHGHGSEFGRSGWRAEFADGGATERMADSFQSRLEGHAWNVHNGNEPGRIGTDEAGSTAQGGESQRLAHTQGEGSSPGSVRAALAESRAEGEGSGGVGDADHERRSRESVLLRTEETGRDSGGILEASRGGAINAWGDSYWHPCRDGKYRRVPVEPGLFPLADGLPYKVARRRTVRPPLLRGAGNAICPEVGAEFVKAFLESIGGI